jgi:hypothetical protein
MDIWQRSSTFTFAGAPGQAYAADRWLFNHSATDGVTIARIERSAVASNVPTLAQSGAFFNNALRNTIVSIDAVVSAGEFSVLETRIEGFDWRQIAHRPMNLSFWIKSNKTGTYGVSFSNTGGSVSYVTNYTLSSTSWTKFSLAIPEAPTTPYTWDYSTGTGVSVRFAFLAGTTFQAGAAGNWTAGNLLATSSQVNFASSVGNAWAITGVQLEEGNFGTPLEIRQYGQELAMCHRYYYQGSDIHGAGACGNSAATLVVALPTIMRATPTVVITGVGNVDDGIAAFSISSGSLVSGSTLHPRINVTVKTATTAGNGAVGTAMTATFDAEL